MAEIKNNFGDREIMDDILDSEKALTGLYNTSACECASSALMGEMVQLLCEEHQMQHRVYEEMSRRGWYCPSPAPMDKITKAKDRFQGENS